MGKISYQQKLSDKIFGFFRDWLSQSRVEFRLILENVRLRKELKRKDRIIARRDAYVARLEGIISDTYREGEQKIRKLSQALHDALEQKAELERKFFECHNKAGKE